MATSVVSRYTWYMRLFACQVYMSILCVLFFTLWKFSRVVSYIIKMREVETEKDRERDTNTDKRFQKNKTKMR